MNVLLLIGSFAALMAGHGLRMQKMTARLEFLRARFGIDFPEEEVRALLSLDNPGKPHLGNLMVKYSYAGTKEQAMAADFSWRASALSYRKLYRSLFA